MKQNLAFLTLLLIFISCSSGNVENEIVLLPEVTANINSYGAAHNSGLDCVYNELVSEYDCINGLEFVALSYLHSQNCLYNKELSGIKNKIQDLLFEEHLDARLSFIQSSSLNHIEKQRIVETLTLLDTNKSVFELQNKINRIEQIRDELKNNGSEEYLIGAIDVAIGSLYYWFNNVPKWHETIVYCDSDANLNQTQIYPRNSFDEAGLEWLGEALHDMAGADFWAGLTAGLGSFGNPAVMLTGTLWGSAGRAINILMVRKCP